MIGFFGFRGNGKTLSAVAEIYKDFKRNPNLIVFTNTPFNFPPHKKTGKLLNQYFWNSIEELQALFSFALTDGNLLLRKETIVFIDEANLVMPSRLFGKLPEFVLSFLAESRKLNTEIYFTTQHPIRVEKILRELTENWVQCRRFTPLLIMNYECMISSEGMPIDYMGSSPLFLPKRYYGFYDTHHIVGMSEHLLPKEQSKESKIFDFIERVYTDQKPVEIIEIPEILQNTFTPLVC